MIKMIKTKITVNDLVISEADKSNTVAILHKSEDDSKVYEVINRCGVISNPSYNFSVHVTKARQTINDRSHLL